MDEATGLIGVAGATTVVAAAAGMDATRAVGAVGATGTTSAVGTEGEAPDESGSNRTRNYAIILELIRLRHRCAGPPPRDCRLLCMFIA